jgi:hypothetical protein
MSKHENEDDDLDLTSAEDALLTRDSTSASLTEGLLRLLLVVFAGLFFLFLGLTAMRCFAAE